MFNIKTSILRILTVNLHFPLCSASKSVTLICGAVKAMESHSGSCCSLTSEQHCCRWAAVELGNICSFLVFCSLCCYFCICLLVLVYAAFLMKPGDIARLKWLMHTPRDLKFHSLNHEPIFFIMGEEFCRKRAEQSLHFFSIH